MKRYVRVYIAFIAANLKQLLTYRANFYSTLVTTLVWTTLSVVAVLIYSTQAPSLSGWTRQELIGLTGVFSIITGLCYTLFLASFFSLTEKIRKGSFDYDLVKPLDSQFTATMSRLSVNNIARFVAGLIIVNFSWPQGVSFLDLLMFLSILTVACLSLYGSWVIFVSLNFFSQRLGNIVDFLLELFDQLGRTPSDALRESNSWLFTFLLPFVMVLSFPTKSLWSRLSLFELLFLLIGGLTIFVFSRLFWQFSLRHYTSASS